MHNQTHPNQRNNPNPSQSHLNYYYPQSSPAYYPSLPYRQMPPQQSQQHMQNVQNMQPMDIEKILRLNRGKKVTVYMTFEQNKEWNAKVFKGVIEAAGRDHLILSDAETGKRHLLLMVYLNYVTFDEEINYDSRFNGGGSPSNYSPR